MQTEKMYTVTIDKVTPKYDGQNNLVTEARDEVCNKRVSGISPIVAVIKAYETVREEGKLDLTNLEIGVDGSSFTGR